MSIAASKVHAVAKRGDVDQLRILLSSDPACVSLSDAYKQTPLIKAAICGSVECVKLLLDSGASIDHRYATCVENVFISLMSCQR